MWRLWYSVLATAASVAALAGEPSFSRPTDDARRVVYVAATNGAGAPVTDLTVADFAIKEGGKACEVVSAEPAAGPLRIALLVDDNGTGIFRAGIVRFIERLGGRAEFAISTVTGQTQKLVDYTTDADDLRAAITKLSARPATPDGGQLLEGIYESAKEIERAKSARGVILVLTVGGEEHSTLPAHHVLDQLRKSGAALHVVAVAASALRSTVAVTKPSALLDANLNLSELLGDGPDQSGGSRIDIVASTGLVTGLQQLADSLVHQYAITYVLPDGAKRSDRLAVIVKRGGVTLRAPTRIPKD